MSTIIFKNATVLDVVAGTLVPDRTVIVDGERIAAVDAQAKAADTRVIDLKGRVLMPGLCDAHVHVTASTADFAALQRMSPYYNAAQASEILRGMLARGFTTVRDAAGAEYGLAQAVRDKLFAGPRLLYCGKAISQTGGHADMRTAGEYAIDQCPCCAGVGRICDGVPEIRRACRDSIRQGSTHIKLMVSGGIISPTDRISSTQLADDELAAAVAEAEAAEIYCMAHAYTPRAMKRALVAGVRSIEHGNFLDQDTADLIVKKNAFLVPTLITYDILGREGIAAGLPPSVYGKIAEVAQVGRRALELAVRAGVKTVYGTDLLGTMQRHQLGEFAIRGEIQKPIDVIRSATVNAASLFHMDGEIGVVAPGAFADLLVVDGNPLEDLGVLQNPDKFLKAVMKAGDFFHYAL